MLKSELRVGMKVRANERSNRRYGVTKQSENCEGIVQSIHSGDTFTLKITNHASACEIGTTYSVAPEYFDKVEDAPILVELKAVEKVKVNIGDLVVTDSSNQILVLSHEEGARGLILNQEKVTVYESTVDDLIEVINRNFGKVVRVIPASNLKITEI